ncbi:hypothetical protein PGT21_027760 [Puccinia graminis f. sp. tritici]|uniref:Uncharacterized protein n=1 Tax=Puccinia graminis f. sp. tritici TaxID=56615 RepID=A0A5B0PYS7_PUCGR|nr:hypothetical protein PGT21_027760 [Puccinia graminis f. sp. tritici]
MQTTCPNPESAYAARNRNCVKTQKNHVYTGYHRLPQLSSLEVKSVPSIDLNNAIGRCSIKINWANGLPYWKAVTRLSFNMDPFFIISFGKKAQIFQP